MEENHTRSLGDIKHRLLVVDDEPDICSALSNMLKLEGFSTQESTSGEQALMLLQHNSFDVMILDMQMSGMSGIDVMRQARRLYPDLPIIILTGHATLESAITAAKSEQVIDYILKPAKNQEIIEAVVHALQKRKTQLRQKQLVEAASQVLDAVRQSERPASPASTPEISSPSFSPAETALNSFIHVPPVNLDRKQHLVTIENNWDHAIKLTKGEAAVLASLMAAPNQVLSCREIVLATWGYAPDDIEAASIIRPYISRLRHKIAAAGGESQLIRTVRECGYYFASTEA